MKVLHVIPGLGGGGGAERSLQALAPHLCNHIELHVAFFEQREHLRAGLEAAGVVSHPLYATSRRSRLESLDTVIRVIDPDLVHTTLLEADLVGRASAVRRRVPVVSSLVNVSYERQQFEGDGFKRGARRMAIWAADVATARTVVAFHALTDHVANTMSRRLLIPRSRITVIPRGRGPAQLGERSSERRSSARSVFSIGEAPFVVAAARHERQKGLDVLLRAVPIILQKMPEARFAIGGRNGLETDSLLLLARELAIEHRIQFIGPRDDVAELMCAADVWCVPSRWEGLGGILVEAMALEVPVVASDIPPIREVAGPVPVFDLVTPGDPAALAEGIVRVLQDPVTAQRRAEAGRARFLEHFTVERTAEQTLEFFGSAISKSRLRVNR